MWERVNAVIKYVKAVSISLDPVIKYLTETFGKDSNDALLLQLFDEKFQMQHSIYLCLTHAHNTSAKDDFDIICINIWYVFMNKSVIIEYG